jgi:hypothetical protein
VADRLRTNRVHDVERAIFGRSQDDRLYVRSLAARAFRAAGTSRRLAILEALAVSEASPSVLAAAQGRTAARDWAYDFRELAKAGIIEVREAVPARGGVERHYGLTDLGDAVLEAWGLLESRLSA